MQTTKEKKDTTEVKAEVKGRKKGPEGIYVPYFICQKKHGLSATRVLVYCWIYAHNEKTGKGQSEAFGKPGKGTLHKLIADDLGLSEDCVDENLGWLEENGWLKETSFMWKGIKMVGYLCLLDKEGRVAAKAGQQEMQLEGEKPENAVQVESNAQGDDDMGELYQYGIRFYYDEAGEMVQVPLGAPARPTRTAVWSNDPEGWYEPDEIPERESEY